MFLDGRGVDVAVVDDFREIDFGDWEGLTREEIAARDPGLYHTWQERGSLDRFPGGDVRAEFFDRVRRAALEVFDGIGTPSLAVLHKGVIKGVLSALLGTTIDELTSHTIELGSIQRLERIPDGWKLLGINETGHLGEYRKEGS